MEMNFCRRCGTQLESRGAHVYQCANGHTIYANASPAAALILFDSKGRVLTIRRGIDPGKGELDFPGGFCDDRESAEAAVERETREEIGLSPQDYTAPKLVCTAIDDYMFGGEVVPVLSIVYSAKLVRDTVQIVAGDDAEEATFVPLQELDPEIVYFDGLKEAVKQLQEAA